MNQSKHTHAEHHISFSEEIREGIPDQLPPRIAEESESDVNHAPRRPQTLSAAEELLALRNALRYFPQEQHATLAPELARELREEGRIYMRRLRPRHSIYARPLSAYPARCAQAASIMLMIQNNLSDAVAQHPH